MKISARTFLESSNTLRIWPRSRWSEKVTFEIADFILKNKESLQEFGDFSEIISRLDYIIKNYDEWMRSVDAIWKLPFSLSDKDKGELWDIYKSAADFKVEFKDGEDAWGDD